MDAAKGMKRRRTLLGETQCVEAASQCADIEVVYNIRYHPELSHNKVSMDLYRPAKSSKCRKQTILCQVLCSPDFFFFWQLTACQL